MTTFIGLSIMLGLAVGLLWLVWNGPELFARFRDDGMRALARMARHARRHNTVVRYYNGTPFVVTNQTRGLVYMLEGRSVSRERLIQSLGQPAAALVARIEKEEQLTAPNPTRLTMLLHNVGLEPEKGLKGLLGRLVRSGQPNQP